MPDTNHSACDDCDAGTYSATGAASCTSCDAGKSSAAASDACALCAAGTTSSAGASACDDCEAGAYSATGAASCTACEAGKVAAQPGSSECVACVALHDKAYTSLDGEASCGRATQGFYWDAIVQAPRECPDGAKCDSPGGTVLATIAIKPDYYRLALSSTQVYKCGTGNCLGGLGNTTTCREGSGGVLCAVCDDKYYLKSPSEDEGDGSRDDDDDDDTGDNDRTEGGNATTNDDGGTDDNAADDNNNAQSLPTCEECDYSLLTNQ